jgi:hypothetical protein
VNDFDEQGTVAEGDEFWYLRLYVAGQSPSSLRAFTNLKDLCEMNLAGRYEIRVVARERGLVQQGGASLPVEVPDLKDKKLTMSGIFLSTASPGAPATTETVSHRFQRGASLSFQFYVYNPALDAQGHSDVVLQAQVWSGGKATAASPVQPVRLQQKDGVPVPETNVMALEGLAAGAYELRVVVQDRKAGATAFRKVPFTID